jgi:hypothetical protein
MPIILMIGLIPMVRNDYLLAAIYIIIIIVSFVIKYDRKDLIFLLAGSVLLTLSEYLFISTGVEVFNRQTLLFGMPIWLPVLWGYAFVVIRRGIVIIDDYLK